jgi:ribosomal protein S18 acetylase RimI-like enzyme
MNSVTIREAIEDDVPAIFGVYSSAGIGDENSFTAAEAKAHFAKLKQYPSFRVFVALVDQAIVGTYALLIMENMAKRDRRSGVVENVAVHPLHQGRGVGRAMMQHALEQCRQADCYKLTLSSNLKRADAHRFYDALGFERHGYSFRVQLSK